MPEYTPWFSGDVTPVRDGVYQRIYDAGTKDQSIRFCRFWNGAWRCCAESVDEAAQGDVITSFQSLTWRGLTKEAKHA